MNYSFIKYSLLSLVFILISLIAKSQATDLCSFSYSINKEISNLTYQFQDESITNKKILAYDWQFGDGESSSRKNPLHQYLDYGEYQVSLTILLDDSSFLRYSERIEIFKDNSANCDAYFSFFNIPNQVYTIKFVNNSFHDPNDSILLYTWDFGDNSQLVYTKEPIHQYPASGTYQVTLTMLTFSNCQSTKTATVVVGSGGTNCGALFTKKADTSNALKYFFHDDSYSTDPITSHKWYFDDGDSSSLQDPTHTFQYPGIYEVRLKIETNNCSSEYIETVVVGNPQKYNVWGRVYAGNYTTDKCVAYLYKQFNNYYKPIDTVELTSVNDTLGVFYFYQVYEGVYKVKVILPDSSVYQQDFAPTYYGDSYYWANSLPINLFNDIAAANVSLVPTNKLAGTSYISGFIDNSSNADFSLGNVEILLLDNSNNIIDYTFSNSNGAYEFENIASGQYKVMGEITGLNSIPLSVYLSNFDTINNLNLFINKSNITSIQNESLDISDSDFKIYPNPANNILNISLENMNSKIDNIEVINSLGQTILGVNLRNTNVKNYQIDISNLPKGLYILRIMQLDSKLFVSKKFIKN